MRPENVLAREEQISDETYPVTVERRKDSQDTPHIESFERDSSEFLILFEEQPGDEETAQHKEDHHTVRSRYPVKTEMIDDDQQDRHCAQPIQNRNVRRREAVFQAGADFLH